MKEEILCAGYGGQGIMVMGRVLAYAAMNSGYHVTWMPSYGAEVRGGTAHSMVRVHSNSIASPAVRYPTSCIVMNKPSLLKFSKRVKSHGLLLIDSSKISDGEIKQAVVGLNNICVKKAPFTEIAMSLGEKKVANMVTVGAFNKVKKLFSIKELIKAVSFILRDKDELITINEKAILHGYNMEI
ncbi:MAG: 2-oxoacid:acceptor oxidoreductase family protein [Candidatus Omnitrophica bacterium]|nr:2-oxoacid:acceptor oxidoreductase family protein [Candidatus Omnitrophota bacterium]